jgi:hypothetical protein
MSVLRVTGDVAPSAGACRANPRKLQSSGYTDELFAACGRTDPGASRA